MTKNYQLICLVSALAEPAEREQIIEKINRLIRENEGKILANYPPDERVLGYPVKKEKNAVLLVFDFSGDQKRIPELQKSISIEGLILRSFLKEVPEYKEWTLSRRKSAAPILADNKSKKLTEGDITGNISEKEQKVELKDIDKKIEEIFNTKENEFK
ncbi:30S ribosomal protein S6 [Patescibacteria group bacterium]|nr:30S ribosomal protein S6 [Patescibacteria group bacterium]